MTPAAIAKETAREFACQDLISDRDIVRAVADRMGVTVDEIRGRSREAAVVQARRAAIKALHMSGRKVGRIGRAVARDHSTVIYSLKQMAAR